LAVRSNLEAVLGTSPVSDDLVREVFRNFALYLADFFRFGRLNRTTIRRWVRFEGLSYMEEAWRAGGGVIGISAHLGNYEMAAAVLSILGMPVEGVALTHRDPKIDRFFERQRARVGVTSIPIQKMSGRAFLERSLSVLKQGRILGLVADRDFFGHGLEVPMFGKSIRLPMGPAWFGIRTGAPIVPCFLVRESDGTFRMIAKPPLSVPKGMDERKAIRSLTEMWGNLLADVIRRYPTQWYMFQPFWKPSAAVIL
jgi:KDO2-lipid IV(A) lauroyltransferase